MLSSTFIVVAAIAGVCLGSPFNINPQIDYGNANIYVDLLLFRVNKQLPDSIPIPDIGGPFNMHDCVFLGTERGIYRNGDATVVVVGNTVKFAATFQMRDVGIKCHWKYGMLRGTAEATTAKVTIDSGLSLVIAQGEHPWLTEFRVTSMEPTTTDVTGLTPGFNWLAEDIINWMLANSEEGFSYIIEHQVRDLFQDTLNNMVIP